MAMHELPHGSPLTQCDLLRFKWVKERLNKGWGMDEGNGDLLTGDGTG
jgi:hypothetical protein